MSSLSTVKGAEPVAESGSSGPSESAGTEGSAAVVRGPHGYEASLSAFLEQRRRDAHMSVSALAAESGMSRANYYLLLRDRQKPQLALLVMLLNALGHATTVPRPDDDDAFGDLVVSGTEGPFAVHLRHSDPAERTLLRTASWAAIGQEPGRQAFRAWRKWRRTGGRFVVKSPTTGRKLATWVLHAVESAPGATRPAEAPESAAEGTQALAAYAARLTDLGMRLVRPAGGESATGGPITEELVDTLRQTAAEVARLRAQIDAVLMSLAGEAESAVATGAEQASGHAPADEPPPVEPDTGEDTSHP